MNLSEFKHNLQYWKSIQKVFLMNTFAYRADLFSATLGAYGWLFITIVFLNVLYSGVGDIGGWSFEQSLIILGAGQIIFYLHYALVPGSSNHLVRLVKSGGLDKHILKPTNVWFTVSIDSSGIFTLLPSLIGSVAIFAYGINQSNIQPDIIDIFGFCLAIIMGFLITWFTYLLVSSFAFHFTDISGFLDFVQKFKELEKYPATIFTGFSRLVFLFIIPVGLVAFPAAEHLVNGFNTQVLTLQILATCWILGAFLFSWKRGIKNYSSASS